ncbi:MAG: ATP-binding cassette domain-containing protein [Phaeodactylibacter sp.]|nr:ATP-binding cassette domain-containing protein [Phaeodactylibacter sp.]
MITIQNLCKQYGHNVVLDIPELAIPAGQRFGLVGNNGAGKTTLFSLLLDLIRPVRGAVFIEEKNVGESSEWKSFTGSFLDDSFLIGFLSPEEYFQFVGKLYGMNTSDVSEYLNRFEAFFNGEILDRGKYVRDMSKGNQKKVGIAAALMGAPRLVVLDEPFANLDPSSQIRLKNIIRELGRDKTILISSHDLAHVTEVCERIVVLEKGKLIRDIHANRDTLRELEAYFSA